MERGWGGGEVAHRLEMLSALYISCCLLPAPSYRTYQRPQRGSNLHVFPADYVRFKAKAGPKIKDYCQRWQMPALA